MCCSGKPSVRATVNPQAQKNKPSKQPIITKISKGGPIPSPINRQYTIPRTLCPKCGYPAMLVHISGRERQQCTNIDCKYIIQ